MSSPPSKPHPAGDALPRRGILYTMLAAVTGAVVAVVPFAAGVFTFLDPLRRRADASGGDGKRPFIRVASLDELPIGGPPQSRPVIAERRDAWTHYPPASIGSVYLQRTGEKEVLALNTSCPHAGCYVDFIQQADRFQCPCHTSAFALDGRKLEGPSPRPLDSLEIDAEALARGDVCVRFENFLAGIPEKKVVD